MKLSVIEPHGFCFGVRSAVKKALEAGAVYCFHELVHNEVVVSDLRRRGMIFVDSLENVPVGAKVLFSAHGVSPAVRAEARERKLEVIDATCPFVERVHRQVISAAKRNIPVVIVGHAKHAEVQGIAGEAPDNVTVIKSADEVDSLAYDESKPLSVVTQTTLGVDEVLGVLEALRKRYPLIETSPAAEVCTATRDRQQAIKDFVKSGGDGVLVLGSVNSSNTNRLVEIAQGAGAKSMRAGAIGDIDGLDFSGIGHLGITSGASTPESFLREVFDKISVQLRQFKEGF